MVTGNFHYLKDSYYTKFPNCNLIGNKDNDAEKRMIDHVFIVLRSTFSYDNICKYAIIHL